MKTLIHLAPIKGITDRTFRNAFIRHFGGVDSVLAPFVTKSDSESKLKALSPELNTAVRTVPQILTKSPDEFISLARKLEGYGCKEVNWNLGCPFAAVVKKGEGSALLEHPDSISLFLEKVCSSLTLPISIKMRIGMHAPDEILKLIPVINSFPVKEIIIHPRTGGQMYTGDVDLDAFEKALKLSEKPVIYNGDIKKEDDFKTLFGRFPSVNGWMIGRGLLINPCLAMEIKNGKAIPESEKIERIKNFTGYLLDAYINDLQSDAHVLDKMRGLWFYISQSFPDSRKIEKRIRKSGSIFHYKDEIKRVFDSVGI